MPLLKLWKTLRGRSSEAGTTESTAATDDQRAPKEGRQRGNILRLGGRGPHASLCKQVRKLPAIARVLEIGVGDGSRGAALIRELEKRSHPFTYAVIDRFEQEGGGLTLKRYHQLMRAEGVRPHIFPNQIEAGLGRVSSTLGAVDLVVLGVPRDEWETPNCLAAFRRIASDRTVLLLQSEEEWIRYELGTGQRRVAA